MLCLELELAHIGSYFLVSSTLESIMTSFSWDMVLCSKGWPQNCCESKADLECTLLRSCFWECWWIVYFKKVRYRACKLYLKKKKTIIHTKGTKSWGSRGRTYRMLFGKQSIRQRHVEGFSVAALGTVLSQLLQGGWASTCVSLIDTRAPVS